MATAPKLLLAALALCTTLAACGQSAPSPTENAVDFPVAQDVTVEGSPTFTAITDRGKVIIGVKDDQPGLGFRDATTGQYSGFDIDIATMLAAGLGFGRDAIEFKTVPSAAREDSIERGEVDMYVGGYSITDRRKERVSFAGPYLVSGQDLLVRSDETSITGPDSLAGHAVCSATGSSSIQTIRERALTDDIVEFQTYTQCVDQLLSGQVDAVTTDDAILRGYAAQQPDALKVVGQRFSTEYYGIGLPRDDSAFRAKINDLLDAAYADGTWAKIYDATLGAGGETATPPPVQRY